jgi:hypothetical protein
VNDDVATQAHTHGTTMAASTTTPTSSMSKAAQDLVAAVISARRVSADDRGQVDVRLLSRMSNATEFYGFGETDAPAPTALICEGEVIMTIPLTVNDRAEPRHQFRTVEGLVPVNVVRAWHDRRVGVVTPGLRESGTHRHEIDPTWHLIVRGFNPSPLMARGGWHVSPPGMSATDVVMAVDALTERVDHPAACPNIDRREREMACTWLHMEGKTKGDDDHVTAYLDEHGSGTTTMYLRPADARAAVMRSGNSVVAVPTSAMRACDPMLVAVDATRRAAYGYAITTAQRNNKKRAAAEAAAALSSKSHRVAL